MAIKLVNKQGNVTLTTPSGSSTVVAEKEVWLGSKEQYTADKASGIITASMLCFIVDEGTTPTPSSGVIQNGNVLTILSDVVITQNNKELVLGA